MQMLSFNREQMIAFDTLMRERRGRYIDESSISSYSREKNVFHSKPIGESCNLENIVDSLSAVDVKNNIENNLIHDDNVLFYNVMSNNDCINFAVHIHDMFSCVLNKEQIEPEYEFIDFDYSAENDAYWGEVADEINRRFRFNSSLPSVFFLKKNGYVVFGDRFDNIIKTVDKTHSYFFDNYESELYQKDVDGLLIRDELDGCKISLKEKHILLKDMLEYFDKICRANDIKYSLTGGSLIGAVRHNGFIPWDDDADVFLARPEYNKLKDAFANRDGRYVLISNQTDEDYPFPYLRLVDTKTFVPDDPNTLYSGRGMFVDVMAVDGLPNNRVLRFVHVLHMRLLFRLRRSTIKGRRERLKSKHIIKYYIKLFLNLFADTNHWNDRMIACMDKYSFEDSIYVANLTAQYGKREILSKKGFDEYYDVKFENSSFMVFGGYEEYLAGIYKNYWRLPGKGKRPDHKHEAAYWNLNGKELTK